MWLYGYIFNNDWFLFHLEEFSLSSINSWLGKVRNCLA